MCFFLSIRDYCGFFLGLALGAGELVWLVVLPGMTLAVTAPSDPAFFIYVHKIQAIFQSAMGGLIVAALIWRAASGERNFSGGEEAVEYLRENRADLLVLDMIMAPGIDGLETYQRVLQIHPKQKAILVSGFSETNRVREAQRLGAGAYIKKPYAMETIGMAIRDELNR